MESLLILGAGQYGFVAKETAEAMGCFGKIEFLDDTSPLAVGHLDDLGEQHFDAAFIAMSVVSIAFFSINVLILLLVINSSVKNKNVRQAIMLTLLCRVAVAIWDTYAQGIFILPNAEGDAISYRQVAMSFAFGSRANLIDLTNYPFYLGQFYKFFGIQDLVAKFINIYLAIFAFVLIYRIMVSFSVRKQIIEKTILLGCLLPNSWIICTTTLQESIISFCVIASVYLYTRWWFTKRTSYVLYAVLISFFGGMLHIGGLIPAIGIVVVTPMIRKSNRKLNVNPTTIMASLLIGLILLAFVSLFGDTFLRKIGGTVSVTSITSKGVGWGGEGSGDYYAGVSGLSGFAGLLVNSPIKALNFVFAPLPWQWRGMGDIIAFMFSATYYIYTMFIAIKAFRRKTVLVRNDQIWAYFITLILMLILASIMFGWGVSNAGTALRHREKYTYICLLLFAFSKEILFRRRQYGSENISNYTRLQGRAIS